MVSNKEKTGWSKEKDLLKTKTFWFVAGLSILFIIGMAVPDYSFLQLPFGIAIAGTMPGVFAIKFSVPFAMKFVSFHMKRHKSYSYRWNDKTIKNPSTLKFALSTTLYSFAITYNILD